jgi:photosystem II stability/assembly factor-like uncharacterized protein
MKSTAHFIIILCIIIVSGCEKDPSSIPDNQDKQGFDIVIDENKYYEKEIFSEEYLRIYDKWRLEEISGGYAGNGYTPDFDELVVEPIGIFKFFRNDSLLNYGKIEIEGWDDYGMQVSFLLDSSSGNMGFYDMEKHVYLRDSALVLYAPCCDRFNYHFIRCSEYSKSIYYQKNPQLDEVLITLISVPEGKSTRYVFFTDMKKGYILCTDNTILKTVNGGDSWLEYNTGTDLPLYSLFFLSENIGFAAGGESDCYGSGCTPQGSIILKTVNGGENWERQVTPAKGELYSVSFIDNNIGFAVGAGLHIKTNNGGTSWEEFTIDNTGVMKKVFFLNNQTGFLCGLFNNLFKTIDGGQSWINLTEQNATTIRHFKYIQFIDENIGFLTGDNCRLLKTTDGGLSFIEIKNSPGGIGGMFFKTEYDGIVFGYKSYSNGNCNVWQSGIHVTTDGGIVWQGDNKVSESIEQICSPVKNVYYGIYSKGIVKVEVK